LLKGQNVRPKAPALKKKENGVEMGGGGGKGKKSVTA